MSTGTCKYGRTKCWFHHEESENVNEDKNNDKLMKDHGDVMEKLLKIMENFTNQIVKMKETNNLKEK